METIVRGEKSRPDICLSVVLGAADNADVDHVPSAWQCAMPLDARVGYQNNVSMIIVAEFFEEVHRSGSVPEEFIRLAR